MSRKSTGHGGFVVRCTCGWLRRFASEHRADVAMTWHRQNARHDFWKDGHTTMMHREPITESK